MSRRTASLVLVVLNVLVIGGCAQSPASTPPVPDVPAGWVSLGSLATDEGGGFSGFAAEPAGRRIALHVACQGGGTLVVTLGAEDPMPASGMDAVVFPCTADGAPIRRELDPSWEPMPHLVVSGAVLPGMGEPVPTVFALALEAEETPAPSE